MFNKCFHGEVSLKHYVNEINSFHSTIKFASDSSKEKCIFLDVEVTFQDVALSTDLFIKPTDTLQFLDLTSYHHFHCKKCIPFSQTLKLNIFCSYNSNYDKCCKELKIWLLQKGDSEKMARKKILPMYENSRENFLEKVKSDTDQKKMTFNITYYPVFSKCKKRFIIVLYSFNAR